MLGLNRLEKCPPGCCNLWCSGQLRELVLLRTSERKATCLQSSFEGWTMKVACMKASSSLCTRQRWLLPFVKAAVLRSYSSLPYSLCLSGVGSCHMSFLRASGSWQCCSRCSAVVMSVLHRHISDSPTLNLLYMWALSLMCPVLSLAWSGLFGLWRLSDCLKFECFCFLFFFFFFY